MQHARRVIAGAIGPAADAYLLDEGPTAAQAAEYHRNPVGGGYCGTTDAHMRALAGLPTSR